VNDADDVIAAFFSFVRRMAADAPQREKAVVCTAWQAGLEFAARYPDMAPRLMAALEQVVGSGGPELADLCHEHMVDALDQGPLQ
jgi:hypothetical protein